MGVLDKIIKRLGYVSVKQERTQPQIVVRGFAAAEQNRYTEDWKAYYVSIDRDIYQGLRILRAHSRDLTQNDAYANRFINLCVMNIVGPNGFSLQVKSFDWIKTKDGEYQMKYDEVANSQIEQAFAQWSRRENCTVTGTQSFIDVQKLLIKHAARDGEFLVRKIYDRKSKFGFRLQLLQPDLLDERYNRDLTNGNIIRMGIEFDKWRKPVAYHLKKVSQKNEIYSGYSSPEAYDRISADEIYHGFEPDHASQSRGVPWMTPSMLRMRMISEFEMAGLTNARASAGKMGFIYTPAGEAPMKPPSDGTDLNGNIINYADPGSIEVLPPGMEFKEYDPKFPSDQHYPFMKTTLRGVSSGVGVGYNTFANDLEGVNYSSIRAGVIDEREMWKSRQTWFIESFLGPLFTDWLRESMLTGAITLPFVKFDKFNAARWTGRRWAWVDPLKDMQAHLLARLCGFETSSQIVADQGGDLEENYAEIAREQNLAKKHGIVLKTDEVQITLNLQSSQDGANGSQAQE